jgi:hypothetical protein
MRVLMGDVDPKIGRSRKRRNIIPYLSNEYQSFACCGDNIPPTILNPSRGWMGIKLNIASKTFIAISVRRKKSTIPRGVNETVMSSLIIIEATVARIRFAAGPAREMRAASRRGFRKLNGSN